MWYKQIAFVLGEYGSACRNYSFISRLNSGITSGKIHGKVCKTYLPGKNNSSLPSSSRFFKYEIIAVGL